MGPVAENPNSVVYRQIQELKICRVDGKHNRCKIWSASSFIDIGCDVDLGCVAVQCTELSRFRGVCR